MRFFVNPKSGVPIYKQIVQQIKKGVAGGILKPGDRLPTVREVALDLTVNPNTVARAYRELEAGGIITSVQGRGTFISREITPATAEKEAIMRENIRGLFREAGQLNLTPQEVRRIFFAELKEWEEGGEKGEPFYTEHKKYQ